MITTASVILHEFHSQKENDLDPRVQQINIIETAAKLIKNDINMIKSSSDFYPANLQESLDFLPDSLITIPKEIIFSEHKLKLASIGQALYKRAVIGSPTAWPSSPIAPSIRI